MLKVYFTLRVIAGSMPCAILMFQPHDWTGQLLRRQTRPNSLRLRWGTRDLASEPMEGKVGFGADEFGPMKGRSGRFGW